MTRKVTSSDVSDEDKLRDFLEFLNDKLGRSKDSASVANVTPGQFSRYLSGKSQPTFLPVARLARHLGISLDGWETKGKKKPMSTMDLINDGNQWWENIKNIEDDVERLAVLTVVFGPTNGRFINLSIQQKGQDNTDTNIKTTGNIVDETEKKKGKGG